jgi:hypothetical protein
MQEGGGKWSHMKEICPRSGSKDLLLCCGDKFGAYSIQYI